MRGFVSMKHIVMFSGGIGSWAAAKRVVTEHGADSVVLLFCDTRTEDEDVYRFLREAAANVGAPLVTIADGRDVWEVFRDSRFIGNSGIDLCSRILKREIARQWVDANCDQNDRLYVGIGWDELHRLPSIVRNWSPYSVAAPMCDAPYLSKPKMIAWARSEGLEPPRLYAMGFPHANCGGFCVKAGHAQFKLLLDTMPERFAYHEQKEQELRDLLGKDVAILRDRRGGKTKPLTLRAFRERIEAGGQCDLFDWGGCGCFVTE